jgi:hypothetical protein
LVLAATRETSIEETREGEVAPLSELDETKQEEVRILEFVHGLPKGERAIFLKRVAAANNLSKAPQISSAHKRPQTVESNFTARNDILQEKHREPTEHHTPTSCFHGKRIVMVGDSMMRYQYLALVYWLEHGIQPPPGYDSSTMASDKESMCNEFSWKDLLDDAHYGAGWKHFYEGTSALMNGHEYCDCWRRSSSLNVENRYFRLSSQNISITYLSLARVSADSPASLMEGGERSASHGHWRDGWTGSDIGEITCKPGQCTKKLPYKWVDVDIFDIISDLNPTHLFVNCGLWGETLDTSPEQDCFLEGVSPTKFVASLMAAVPHGSVFWKTTTLKQDEHRDQKYQSSIISSFRAAGAEVWDAAAVMGSRSISTNHSLYWNDMHTHCIVHNMLNDDFVRTICGPGS